MKQNVSVAIIGMGCFFPQSSDLKGYWRLLFNGEDAITDIPETHWSPEDYFDADPAATDHVYCKRGGFLSPVSFDPTEFGIPPSSLEATDTSQLLALVAAKRALEDAGYGDGESFNREKTSVILGVTGTQELVIPLSSRLGFPKWRRALEEAGVSSDTSEAVIEKISDSYVPWQENSFPGLLGNVVAGRIANRLDLGGTNCVVDAACASSLSALHLGILELSSGRADMVATGGVDTLNDIFMHMCFSKTHTLSPTGDAKPFSKDADGTVLGEGIGMLVLKRLEDAEKDGDRIYAVIKGIGSSSDGKSRSIYAPNARGQEKALRHAYEDAGMAPGTIGLIEAHGTGTQVGDRVEFEALNHVFSESDSGKNRCALGSVKSNIGHTKAAAGAAGLIKSALSLYHKVLPPTLKADVPDPDLGIDESPFYLNTETRPWLSAGDVPRRAGVSAFGFGGSNFHVVLEEYEKTKQEIAWDGSIDIIALSAPTHEKLADRVRDIRQRSDQPLTLTLVDEDISRLGTETRHSFSPTDPYRMLLVHDRHEAFETLIDRGLAFLEKNPDGHPRHENSLFYGGPEEPGKLAFIFPGQGSQYVGMGRDLTCLFPRALQTVEDVDRAYMSDGNDARLSDYIYPKPGQERTTGADDADRLRQTDIAQPAIGATSVAMAEILGTFGIRPDQTCGHSFGEITALWAAGWIDRESFFRLAISRGRLMAAAGKDKGTMLAVHAPLDALDALIDTSLPQVILANRNSPNQGVLSGSVDGIAEAERLCKQQGFRTTRLPVSAAFHSSLVQDAQKPFRAVLDTIDVHPTDIPVYSNTTGRPYPADPDGVKDLLGEHLLCPVDFVKEIEALFDGGARTFVEVGPRSVLTGLVKVILKDRPVHAISMDASSGKQPGIADLAKTLCHLASLGHPVELKLWEASVSGTPQRKQKMNIPIGGANIRPQPPADNPLQKHVRKPRQEMEKRPPSDIPAAPIVAAGDPDKNSSSHRPSSDPSDSVLSETLKVVQEGLKTMEVLQRRTAEAHNRFLETQSEASRTLQKMMDHAQQMVSGSLGSGSGDARLLSGLPDVPVSSASKSVPAASEGNASDSTADGSLGRSADGSSAPPTDGASTSTVEERATAADRETALAGSEDPALAETLLSVVSDLTGYPADMLGLEMDIEADLGIDSIKRVEILSTLEEKMPDLPTVSPEVMGTLKTLGQIIDYLSYATLGGEDGEQGRSDSGGGANSQPDSGHTGAGKNDLCEALLAVVSDLTGYPRDMLGLDMDIEADLGIDSIKRVEILSTLEEKMPDLPVVSPEVMGSLKTLGQIIDYLADGSAEDTHRDDAGDPVGPMAEEAEPRHDNVPDDDGGRVGRNVVSIVEVPIYRGEPLSLAPGRPIYVTDDHDGLSEAIIDEFTRRRVPALIVPEDMSTAIKKKAPAGLVILSGWKAPGQTEDQEADEVLLKEAFLLAHTLAPDLLESADRGGALFATISRLDGAFGFKGLGMDHPISGGLAGLAKTAAIEWEGVRCRAIDIAPNWDDKDRIASAVVSALLNPDPASPVEVGLDPNLPENYQVVLELESCPVSPDLSGDIDLSPGDVMIVTGGGRGITAACALALAQHSSVTFVLLGRSPQPLPEPKWIRSLDDEAVIKRAIIQNQFDGQPDSPRHVDDAFKTHMANREINRTLEDFQAIDANVVYIPVDVRDPAAVRAVMDDVRLAHGPIKGIIHGAGILQDRLIIDKTPEQFEKVFDTKVRGLNTLLEVTGQDPLRYIVIFSSITARLGNRGQVDYAMANEALNKIAQNTSIQRPGCNVIAINWGPWDGGMVSAALKKEFARNHIPLIPIDAGAESMVQEMIHGHRGLIEVVIGGGIDTWEGKNVTESDDEGLPLSPVTIPEQRLTQTFKRDIDVDHYPVLASHVINDHPVVPFALMTEWIGHGALHENPGLLFCGLDDMRLLSGITLDQERRTVRLLAGKARKVGSFFEVDVEVRDGLKADGTDMIHYKAKAILADDLSEPPVFTWPDHIRTGTYSRSTKDVYENILFHGEALQGIKEITSCSSRAMVASLSSAPLPEEWMADPLRTRWIGDPLVLDSAFQMAIIWCFEEKGMVSLPSYSACYRQYRSEFPTDGVTAVLEIADATDHKMRGDYTFLDSDGVVVAQLTGYEAIMDPSLHKAF